MAEDKNMKAVEAIVNTLSNFHHNEKAAILVEVKNRLITLVNTDIAQKENELEELRSSAAKINAI